MIVLFGKTSGPKARQYFGSRSNLGIMVSPKGWTRPWCRNWACDNDAYANRDNPAWWCREGEARWLKMLDKVAAQESRPLFRVLPDVVANWAATLSAQIGIAPNCCHVDCPLRLPCRMAAISGKREG